MKKERPQKYDAALIPKTERPPNSLSGIYLIVSGISKKNRLKIIEFLMSEPKTPSQLARLAGMNFSCCHYHLRSMINIGIVERFNERDNDGRKRLYRIVEDNAPYVAAMIENLRRIRIVDKLKHRRKK